MRSTGHFLAACAAPFLFVAMAESGVAQTAPAGSGTTASGSTLSATASSGPGTATKDCGAILTAAKVDVGGGVTNDQVCTTMSDAIAGTASADVGSGKPLINYTQEDKTFYQALGKSIRKHGGKEPIIVNMGLANSPVVTVDTLRGETAPSYNEIGLGIWVDRIQKAGGKYCTIPTDQVAPALILAFLEFLAKDAVPFLLDKYHMAQAYKMADRMDVLVGYNTTGTTKGRIMWMKFVPKGSVECKPAP